MNSIKEKTSNELVIKKSKFIALAYPVNSDDEANEILKAVRKEHYSANHHCYAYVIGDSGIIQKASDDGEPTRTAGFPILEVLHKNELTNIIVIVVRYFGGTLLGAGGLIRAYSSSAVEVIKKVCLTKKQTTFTCSVKCSYDFIGSIDKYLRENTELLDVLYDKDITFSFKINSDNFDTVKETLFSKNNFEDKLIVHSTYSEYA
ncbi:MAG: YigZ family protein [Tenericutes bacterium]|nr:YigZ family protein [Mycoplasmatota bacterium]